MMVGVGVDGDPGGRVRHTLCPLESYKEGDIYLHVVKMPLWMANGMGGLVLSAEIGLHQWI